jgi:tRNA pseudouridine55 synthase
VGGHLTELRRTRIGNFDVANAMQLQSPVTPLPLLLSSEAVKHVMPLIEITPEQALFIRQGKRISGEITEISALICQGTLVAIAETAGKQSIKSIVVFNDQESNV